MNFGAAAARVLAGEELSREETRELFGGALVENLDQEGLSELLQALADRGETAAEIAGAAEALRDAMVPFEHEAADAVDTCGTGGDGLGSFNLSTAAALVAAGAGARVVKHGNRSVSSKCGSADLLEAAGVRLDLGPEDARTVFEETGMVFLFAPAFHPGMRFVAPVRQKLGIRTLFNFLGPLCNPGGVDRQLLGVSAAGRQEDYAEVLSGLGCSRGYVVHGAGGADELTLAGENRVLPVGEAPAQDWDSESCGLSAAPVEALAGGEATENLGLLEKVLAGDSGPLRDAVVLNAAASLVVAGVSESAPEGVAAAQAALDSGAAAGILSGLVKTSQKVGVGS